MLRPFRQNGLPLSRLPKLKFSSIVQSFEVRKTQLVRHIRSLVVAGNCGESETKTSIQEIHGGINGFIGPSDQPKSSLFQVVHLS